MTLSLTWVPRTSNKKTGDVPTAYVGKTLQECRDSCKGCALLDRSCYAWSGLTRASLTRIQERIKTQPHQYSLDWALRYRSPGARFVRIGAMGDPARADREELLGAIQEIRLQGLSVISYSHFWRHEGNQDLKEICLASCEDQSGAQEALRRGWKPSVILPWSHQGLRFLVAPGAPEGVVCPAQTKGVTCNDCLMCDPRHPVWDKISAIGFLDHSRGALRERQRWNHGKQLPLFGEAPDLRETSNHQEGTTT